MTSTNIIIHNLVSFVHKNQIGSSFVSPALGGVGQGRLFLLFLFRSRRRPKKSLGVSSRRAKRKGVWGKEFLPACFLPKAEWGGKAFPQFLR